MTRSFVKGYPWAPVMPPKPPAPPLELKPGDVQDDKLDPGTRVDERGRWVPGKDGLIHLYHGTTKDKSDLIKKHGLRTPDGMGQHWYMLTTSRPQALVYANGYDDGGLGHDVVHYSLTPEEAREHLGRGVQHDVYGYKAYAAGLKSAVLPPSLLHDNRKPNLT